MSLLKGLWCFPIYLWPVFAYQGMYSGNVAEYEVVLPEKLEGGGRALSHGNPGPVRYKVGHLELDLKPAGHRFMARGLTVSRGRRAAPPLTSHCHLRGSVAGQQHSQVSLSACNDGLVGLIRVPQGEYWLEPLKAHNYSVGYPHLLFKRTKHTTRHSKRHRNKRKRKRNLNCGTKEPRRAIIPLTAKKKSLLLKKNGGERLKRSVSRERHVEVLVVADSSMVAFHKDGDLETYLLTIMNMVSATYQDPSIGNYINIVVVRMILLEDDISEGLNITMNADQALKNFCKWQAEQNPTDDDHPHHHDVAILITRKDICTRGCSTLGVAHVGGMCHPERSCNLNEDNGITLAHTITHELGHNFGMYHDTGEAGCTGREGSVLHVMTPNFEADTTHIAWSVCSRRDITLFLDQGMGHCLEDEPNSEEPFTYPELPPGAIYNADYQCKLQFGSISASVCSPLDEICTRLWCMVDGQCSSMLYPAATGTHCGKHKWCINQKCVPIGEKPDAIDGGWGEWSGWSECSRSCGGGIAMRQRHCDSPVPAFGGKFCIGERQKYKVCNTDYCPEGSPSFRSEQCSIYNLQEFKGRNHTFTPYFEKGEPCHLYCTDTEQTLIEPFGDSAQDGTPCRLGTNDMCIGGLCRKVGCDWIVDSDAVEDKCGICRGNGSQCTTISGEYNNKISSGIVQLIVIPAQARSILIEEKGHYRNFISLASVAKKKFFLNGKGESSTPGEFYIAGATGLYEKKKEKEKIRIPGPIKESIAIYLTNRGKNNGSFLHYEYTITKGSKISKKYEWEYEWSGCSKTCDGGMQVREAFCTEKSSHTRVANHFCPPPFPQNTTRHCNKIPCPTRWWMGPWQPCSVTCGKGVRRRTVLCVSGKNEMLAVGDAECEPGSRPPEKAPCPGTPPCRQLQELLYLSRAGPGAGVGERPGPVWLLHPWESCSVTCGLGYQRRTVLCSQFAKSCNMSAKPPDVRPCIQAPCRL